jgi:hypothetical protein
MDPMLVQPLLDWGVPGVFIIGLSWALWKRTEKYDEIMEKRISEGRESLEAVNRNTTTLEALADLIRATRGGT